MKLFNKMGLVAGLALASWGSAHAYSVYNAFDTRPGTTVPFATPNATRAYDSFTLNSPSDLRYGTENFEAIPTGATGPDGLSLSLGDVGTARLSGANGAVLSNPGNLASLGRYSTGPDPKNLGSRFYEVAAGETFTIDFDRDVFAFGFWGTDIGDFEGTLSVLLFDGAGNQVDANGTDDGLALKVNTAAGTSANASVLFFGMVAQNSQEAIRRVQFVTTSGKGTDAFGFDNFIMATRPAPVPEPASLALAGLALAGLAASRRRRG